MHCGCEGISSILLSFGSDPGEYRVQLPEFGLVSGVMIPDPVKIRLRTKQLGRVRLRKVVSVLDSN